MIAASAPSANPAGGAIAAVIIVIIAFGAYWAPTAVALVRKVPNRGSVAVVNGFLGWTVAGWVVALAMACRSLPATPQPPAAPPAPPAPGRARGY